MKYVPNIIISFIGPLRLPLLVYITLFLSRPSIPHPISHSLSLSSMPICSLLSTSSFVS
jgi:hypothetical protein